MNYCGFFSKDNIVIEKKEIKEITIDNNLMIMKSEFDPITNFQNEEVVDEFLMILEKLRNNNEILFKQVMNLNKLFLDKVSNFNVEDPQSDITFLELIIIKLVNELNLSIFHLHWALNKGIKIAILEIKNVELIHYFLIKLKLRIRTDFFKEILCEYIRSFEEEDFLEAEEIKIFGYVTILHMLINYGKSNINQQETSSLCTPLHLAVFFKQYQFIIILLKLGADKEIKNKNGLTPLEMATENYENGFDVDIYEEIIRLLSNFDDEYNI